LDRYIYKRLGQKYIYQIEDEGLTLDARTFFQSERRTVALDQVPRWPRTLTTSRKWLFYAAAGGVVAFLVLVSGALPATNGVDAPTLALGFAALTGTLWYRGRRYITLFTPPNDQPFIILSPKHPWPPLERFLVSVQEAKLAALERKLAVMALDSEPGQLNGYMIWLRDNGVVDDAGLSLLRSSVQKDARDGRSAGFDIRPSDGFN
jgi:hypothetical protein